MGQAASRPKVSILTRLHAAGRVSGRVLSRNGALAASVFVFLAVDLAAQTLAGWRFFPSFMADQGWYLQVAWRVSQGDILYRDVAWAYGPLPAQALAALFRWFGPDAGLATLLNSLLAACAVCLSYALLRSLLRVRHALILTLYAALAGTYVGGDLVHLHLYTYTQANAWGSVASLAALAAALRGTQRAQRAWLLAAGLAGGLAVLSKPEYGLVALGAVAVLLMTSRADVLSWMYFWAACTTAAFAGLAWQANGAGWWAVWRGYHGYDQLSVGNTWGLELGSLRWLAGAYGFWTAALLLWLARYRRRWRRPALAAALFAGLLSVAMMLPDLFAGSTAELLAALQRGDWSAIRLAPAGLLAWLAAVPWSPLSVVLLWAGWQGHRRGAPPAFWALWTFAIISNLRYVLTGYASGFAMAPALAVLWWLAVIDPAGMGLARIGSAMQALSASLPLGWRPLGRHLARPAWLAGMTLAVLALANLGAQWLVRDVYFNEPREEVSTVLGRVTMAETTGRQVLAVQKLVSQRVPPASPLFAANWGGGWYLTTNLRNLTPFDILINGVGTSGEEAATLREALGRHPPAVFIAPDWMWHPGTLRPSSRRARDVLAVTNVLGNWWTGMSEHYQDETPADVTFWRVLVRQ